MTRNQLAYWALEETKRSNQVRETETERSNLAHEDLTGFQNVTSRTKVEQDFTLGQQSNVLTEKRDLVNKDIGYSNIALRSNELALSDREVGVKEKQLGISSRIADYQGRQADAALMQGRAAITNSLSNARQATVAELKQDTYEFEAVKRAEFNIAENLVHSTDAMTRGFVAQTQAFKAKADVILRASELGPKFIDAVIPF